MKTVCIDQTMLRSEDLTKLIEETESRFVFPDAALMEMCKSDWQPTMRRSLKALSSVPDRVIYGRDNGACMEQELTSGRPLTVDDLAHPEATEWFRNVLLEVSKGVRGPVLDEFARHVDEANATARRQQLDHESNRDSLLELLPTLQYRYTQDFQKRLRANSVDESEYVETVTTAASTVISDESMGVTAGTIARLMQGRSYVARWLWLRVETVTNWLRVGGSEQVTAAKVTNSDVDRYYLALGSYCDQLLTKDRAMANIDRRLRAALLLGERWTPTTDEDASASR